MITGVRGAVWDGTELIVTDELSLREPGPGEVVVRLLASGICHSDINVIDGASPLGVPIVAGHEGAGVVEVLGEGVDSVAVGDAVLIGSMTPCGACRRCRRAEPSNCAEAFGRGEHRFTWRGQAVRAYANVSSFAERTTVRAPQLVPTRGLDPRHAALVGCAVSTGYGVVRNVARVQPGDVVVVVGIGGIGVNAIQTARLVGADRVVAVDVNPLKHDVARRFGADTFVLAGGDPDVEHFAARVLADAGGRVDVAIECSGAPSAIALALRLPSVGGTTALVGIPAAGTEAAFDVGALMRGRRIVGSLNGAIDPARDLTHIVDLALDGTLDIAGQITRVWPLEEIGEAVDAVRNGEVVRAAIAYG